MGWGLSKVAMTIVCGPGMRETAWGGAVGVPLPRARLAQHCERPQFEPLRPRHGPRPQLHELLTL